MRFTVFALLFVLGVPAASAQPAPGADAKVRVIAPMNEAVLPLWVAQEKGFFAEHGLAVVIVEGQNPAEMLAALQERRQEIAVVLLEDVLAFNARHVQPGNPMPAAYAIASLTGGVSRFVLARDFKTLGELKGRRIAIDAAESGQATLWGTFLEGEGVAPGGYELIPVGSDAARMAALASGKVDATMLLPVEANRAIAAGFNALPPMGANYTLIGHVAAISGRWLQSDQARQGFLLACVEAMDWLREPANRDEATALLRKRMLGLTSPEAAAAVAALTTSDPGYSGGCAFDHKQLNFALRSMLTRAPQPPQHMGALVRRGPQEARDALAKRANRDGWEGMYTVSEPLTGLLGPNPSYAKAERAVERALRTRERMADGTWVLEAMFNGLRTTLTNDGRDTNEQRIAGWRAAYPDSVHARLAEAWYWTASAWKARGSEAAANVPKQAFDLMRARLAKAQAILDEIGPRAGDHPVWHWATQHVAFAAGHGADERARILAEAIRREPSFVAHYTEFARGLTPRWGGSLTAYRAFADASVQRSQATEGKSMYAWLYPLLIQTEHDRDPFKDLHVPWPDLRVGYEDLLARHPNSKQQLHLFAHYACRANDGKTFQSLRPKLSQRDFPVSGAYTWEYCNEVLLTRS